MREDLRAFVDTFKVKKSKVALYDMKNINRDDPRKVKKSGYTPKTFYRNKKARQVNKSGKLERSNGKPLSELGLKLHAQINKSNEGRIVYKFSFKKAGIRLIRYRKFYKMLMEEYHLMSESDKLKNSNALVSFIRRYNIVRSDYNILYKLSKRNKNYD